MPYFLPMLILIIQVSYPCYIAKDLGEKFMQLVQQLPYVILCFVIVHISRYKKLNGVIGREEDQVRKLMYPSITWKMHYPLFVCSNLMITRRNLNYTMG